MRASQVIRWGLPPTMLADAIVAMAVGLWLRLALTLLPRLAVSFLVLFHCL